MDSVKTGTTSNYALNTQKTQPKTLQPAVTEPNKEQTATGTVKDTTLSPEELKKARLKSLTTAQDKVLKSKRLKPRNGKTFCNEAVKSTLSQVGVPVKEAGIASKEGYALKANTIAKNLAESAKDEKGYWSEVDSKRGQELANEGLPVVGSQINKGHGHVVTLRPGYAPSDDPMVNNVGVDTKTKRSTHAFNDENPVHYYVPRQEANGIK